MTKDELFDSGLPEECYYIATARIDGAVPPAQKAQNDKIFFDAIDAQLYIMYLQLDYPDTEFCVVKALIVPIEIMKEKP